MVIQIFFKNIRRKQRNALLCKIQFVVLHDTWNLKDALFLIGKVFLKIFPRQNILLAAHSHGIGHKNDAINTSEDQTPGGVIFYLSGYGIKLNLNIVSIDDANIKRQKVKEKRAVTVGFNRNHLGVDSLVKPFVYIFQVRRFAASAGTIIDNFYLDFFIF